MPDPVTIASGISAVKTTFDALRAAIGLVKDAKELLPKEKSEVVNAALATAESSSLIAEAEMAKALGYELCKCTFPPDHHGDGWPAQRPHRARDGPRVRVPALRLQLCRTLHVQPDRHEKGMPAGVTGGLYYSLLLAGFLR
jgi:hypothetical protein